MTKTDTEHLTGLIEEIDILIYLLRELKEEDPVKSKLIRKEYKENLTHNSKGPGESNQKDLFLVGNEQHQSTSDKMHYVNQKGLMCQCGGKMGNKGVIRGRGAKVLRESSVEVKDITLELKKLKKSPKGFKDGK